MGVINFIFILGVAVELDTLLGRLKRRILELLPGESDIFRTEEGDDHDVTVTDLEKEMNPSSENIIAEKDSTQQGKFLEGKRTLAERTDSTSLATRKRQIAHTRKVEEIRRARQIQTIRNRYYLCNPEKADPSVALILRQLKHGCFFQASDSSIRALWGSDDSFDRVTRGY